MKVRLCNRVFLFLFFFINVVDFWKTYMVN
ncbi:hypothetical protein BCVP_CDS0105 [Bacillus phage BC-VP]|nr:hypothetical protein BCVP_CDS0105 [Bacillus phage BC-VP]